MSDEQIEAAALTDPDNLPFTEDELGNVKLVPRVKTIRRALSMTQEEFAQKFQLSLSTLRDWEQGRCQPDQAARTYLKVIAQAPQVVMDALSGIPSEISGLS